MEDSEQLRQLLTRLVPGLAIQGAAAASGQRVVYFTIATDNPQKIPNGQAVLKVCGGLSPANTTYLQREIRLLSEISSPYFPKLFYSEVFATDPASEEPLLERLFVTVEEQVKGRPLTEAKALFKDPKNAKHLLRELVCAGQVLWSLKPAYVHRDIKPANILIGDDLALTLIDLGIVREEGAAGVTNIHAPWGPCTPAYASPEQARNDKMNITFKSDIFSIGVVLYEMLAGTNPFYTDPNTPLEQVLANVARTSQPPLKKCAGVPDGLSDLVDMMMQKEPYRRPRTPDILLGMVEAL
jgi:eukaryotic-like serine/threonine-protein kinase